MTLQPPLPPVNVKVLFDDDVPPPSPPRFTPVKLVGLKDVDFQIVVIRIKLRHLMREPFVSGLSSESFVVLIVLTVPSDKSSNDEFSG